MSTRERAISLAQQIRVVMLDYGVPEVSIEVIPGADGQWTSLDPVGVLSHHVASHPTPERPTPGLALVKEGRSDLNGPLANGHAGVDLVYRIITLGGANHSGYGGSWAVRGPAGSFTVPKDSGRRYLWGTEFEGGYTDEVWDRTYTNRRTGKKMTYHEFMGRANAALTEAIWLPGISSRGRYDAIKSTTSAQRAGYHGEHSTWAPSRKIDRRNYSTQRGRDVLSRYNREDDMFSDTDRQVLKATNDAIDRVRRGSLRRDRIIMKQNRALLATGAQRTALLREIQNDIAALGDDEV